MLKRGMGIAGLCTLLLAGQAWAGALDNPGNGIRGVLIPLAGIADDSSAIYYNPAGLATLKSGKWDAELFGMDLSTGYKYEDNSTNKTYTSNVATIVPNVYVAKGLGTMGFGLGVSAPYGGSSIKYSDLPTPNGSLEMGLGVLAITPTFAIQVLDNLSLGVGVSACYANFTSKYDAPGEPVPGQPYPMVSAEATQDQEYSGIGGYGFNLGALYKISDTLSVGLSYKSPVAMKVSGTQKDNTTVQTPMGSSTVEDTNQDSTVEFTLPTYVTLGLGLRLTDALLLGVSGQYMGYSLTDKYKFTTNGQESVIPTYYKDTFNLDLGAEYRLNPTWTLRAGMKYTPSGTQDAGVTYAPIDTDAIIFGVGGSCQVAEGTEIAVTAGYLYGFSRTHTDAAQNVDVTVNNDDLLLMAAIHLSL